MLTTPFFNATFLGNTHGFVFGFISAKYYLNYGFICHLISVHTKAQTQTSDMYRSLSGAAKMHLGRTLIS